MKLEYKELNLGAAQDVKSKITYASSSTGPLFLRFAETFLRLAAGAFGTSAPELLVSWRFRDVAELGAGGAEGKAYEMGRVSIAGGSTMQQSSSSSSDQSLMEVGACFLPGLEELAFGADLGTALGIGK